MARQSTSHDIAYQVSSTVGPARTAILTLLLAHGHRGDDHADLWSQDLVDTATARLSEALQMMRVTYKKLLGQVGIPETDALQTAHAEALDALERFAPLAVGGGCDADTAGAWMDKQPDLSGEYLKEIEPRINAFLAISTESFAEEGGRRSAAARDEAGRAIKEVGRIGASIRMVAVNATVEASRAGTAGAGFSVIANETQNLAKRMTHVIDRISDTLAEI